MKTDGYNTKQREAILSYIISLGDAHTSAAQIVAHLKETNISIGRTTVYRHLEKLMQSGKIRKYTIDGITGACYQYVSDREACKNHLHLKCESCGELQHLECRSLDELEGHVLDKHRFKINALKTVLYGKCDNCI